MKKLLFLSLISLLFFGCEKQDINYAYEVTGTAGDYDVTIEAAPEGTAQYSNVGNGWQYTWIQPGENPRFLYVSAQNNKNSGTVTVKIIKDGEIIAQNTSSGAYVIATASGTY